MLFFFGKRIELVIPKISFSYCSKMNSKVLVLTCLMVALIASESMARKQGGRRGGGRRGKFGYGGPGGAGGQQFKRICSLFADESTVFDACEDIKENVEAFMDEKKESTKTFMEEQKANLEDVVRSACENLNDDNSTSSCDGKIKANICNKLSNKK